MEEREKLLEVSVVALRVGCSVANVYKLLDKGQLERRKIGAGGKGYRVPESSVMRFMSQSAE